jgi:hypothetical protein
VASPLPLIPENHPVDAPEPEPEAAR